MAAQANARGGGWQRGGPFAHNVQNLRRARRGDVRLAILAALLEKPMNGYQIMQALEEKSQGRWRPSPGAVYPALSQLEDERLIRGQDADGGGGRVFALTEAGKRAAQSKSAWQPPEEEGAGDDESRGLDLAKLIPEIVPAVIQIAQAGTPAQIADAKKVLKGAKKALYRILAEDGDDDEEADV